MYDEFPLGQFKTFSWSKHDVIGAGATSLVYKAICQESGNYVAVKVFNEAAKSRSNVLQLRELELLQKINHENVVQLIDKDETQFNKHILKLLVMEYCNGGSLSSIIEQPENIYGLQQTEFLLVLRHITSGMNELHRLKIVHRDIKPNNILLQILPTGEHIYKLSDFGAARQVEMEDDQFTSICGTEEYLFPDVYERALIDKNIQKSFKAGIDLWSTGVTLYHVATGVLPFRPIGGRHNRETMINITKNKPPGSVSGVQNPVHNTIDYSKSLPSTCQLSKKLQELLVPMLAGLMENNYESMWSFQKFFERSSYIYNLIFISIMNLDSCQMIHLPFENTEKLDDLKEKIEKETKIEKKSQFIIFNNLLFESLVNEKQTIETFPIIDKEHPFVLFSLDNPFNFDNLGVVELVVPDLRCKAVPKTLQEIMLWSKETCGSIYYIKREIYLITTIIELLKHSAIAFKSYMPEMKLKQQTLLHNFKSAVKSLETKLNMIEKLDNCVFKLNQPGSKIQIQTEAHLEIKKEITKFKTDINLYEQEINSLTDKINQTQNLEFLLQNSTLTSKWKNEIDAYCDASQQIYDELVQYKREIRSKSDNDKFERSKFTEFKINRETKIKEDAVKLFQETSIVHFFEFYLRFEKWMSDLINLHNDLMSVQKKLIEFDKSINAPIDRIEAQLDNKINFILESLININDSFNHFNASKTSALTPTISSTGTTASKEISLEYKHIGKEDGNNNDIFANSESKVTWNNFENFLMSLKDFKNQAIEIEKSLDENSHLLKFLHDQFQMNQSKNTLPLK